MIEINKIKTFISGNFETATLSGKIKEDGLNVRLSFRPKVGDIKYQTIGTYSIDIKEDRKDAIKISNYLLNYFLQNGTVLETAYNINVPFYNGGIGVKIGKEEQTLYLSFDNSIFEVFPSLLKDIETYKREGVFKTFVDNFDTINRITFNESFYFNSKVEKYKNDFVFTALSQKNKKGEKIVYSKDRDLICRMIYECINDIDDNSILDCILRSVELGFNRLRNPQYPFNKTSHIQIGKRMIVTCYPWVLDIIKEVTLNIKEQRSNLPEMGKQLILNR